MSGLNNQINGNSYMADLVETENKTNTKTGTSSYMETSGAADQPVGVAGCTCTCCKPCKCEPTCACPKP